MPEITFMVGISSWNFVRAPKASIWAHIHSFSLKFAWEVWFLQYKNFERIVWRACEALVKQPLVSLRTESCNVNFALKTHEYWCENGGANVELKNRIVSTCTGHSMTWAKRGINNSFYVVLQYIIISLSDCSQMLTYLSRHKTTAILQTKFSNALPWMNENFLISNKILFRYVPQGKIEPNDPALVRIMALFTVAYMRHLDSMFCARTSGLITCLIELFCRGWVSNTLRWRHNECDGVSKHQPQAQMTENIKAPRHWPFWGEFTGDRWTPHTKGPVTRKMFPFDGVIMKWTHHS